MKKLLFVLRVYVGLLVVIFALCCAIESFALIGGVKSISRPGNPWWLQTGLLAAIMAAIWLFPMLGFFKEKK